jgi:hypothetical protein
MDGDLALWVKMTRDCKLPTPKRAKMNVAKGDGANQWIGFMVSKMAITVFCQTKDIVCRTKSKIPAIMVAITDRNRCAGVGVRTQNVDHLENHAKMTNTRKNS